MLDRPSPLMEEVIGILRCWYEGLEGGFCSLERGNTEQSVMTTALPYSTRYGYLDCIAFYNSSFPLRRLQLITQTGVAVCMN